MPSLHLLFNQMNRAIQSTWAFLSKTLIDTSNISNAQTVTNFHSHSSSLYLIFLSIFLKIYSLISRFTLGFPYLSCFYFDTSLNLIWAICSLLHQTMHKNFLPLNDNFWTSIELNSRIRIWDCAPSN